MMRSDSVSSSFSEKRVQVKGGVVELGLGLE